MGLQKNICVRSGILTEDDDSIHLRTQRRVHWYLCVNISEDLAAPTCGDWTDDEGSKPLRKAGNYVPVCAAKCLGRVIITKVCYPPWLGNAWTFTRTSVNSLAHKARTKVNKERSLIDTKSEVVVVVVVVIVIIIVIIIIEFLTSQL